jgi:HEAT repeat protein
MGLAWFGDKRAVEPLIRMLPRAGWYEQVKIINLLSTLGDERALDAIRPLMDDKGSEDLRQAAKNAVKELEQRRKK